MSSQEHKEAQYKAHNWASDEKWQSYLNGVYPVPPLAKLEKIKRRWYRNNVDKQFEVDFNSSQTSQNASSQSTNNTNTTSSQRP